MSDHTGKEKIWHIKRLASDKLVAEYKIPVGQTAEGRVKNLLQTFTAKYALQDDEIMSSFLNRNTKRYSKLLEVQELRGEKSTSFSCGENPFFTARIIEE